MFYGGSHEGERQPLKKDREISESYEKEQIAVERDEPSKDKLVRISRGYEEQPGRDVPEIAKKVLDDARFFGDTHSLNIRQQLEELVLLCPEWRKSEYVKDIKKEDDMVVVRYELGPLRISESTSINYYAWDGIRAFHSITLSREREGNTLESNYTIWLDRLASAHPIFVRQSLQEDDIYKSCNSTVRFKELFLPSLKGGAAFDKIKRDAPVGTVEQTLSKYRIKRRTPRDSLESDSDYFLKLYEETIRNPQKFREDIEPDVERKDTETIPLGLIDDVQNLGMRFPDFVKSLDKRD